MKATRLAMFIGGDTPPELGFEIEWYDNYFIAINSNALWSGYFKPASSGGMANIMVFSEMKVQAPNPDYPQNPPNPEDEVPEFIMVDNPIPVSELDISNSGAFSSVWYGDSTQVKISSNPDVKSVEGSAALKEFYATNTGIKNLPALEPDAVVRIDGNALTKDKVDAMIGSFIVFDEDGNPIGANPAIIENKDNAPAEPQHIALITDAGGKVWEQDSGIMKFYTNSRVTTAFSLFVNSGADVNWYLNGVLHTAASNTATFFFTDSEVKEIEVRGGDINQGQWMSMTGKSLVGKCDLGAMIGAAARIDCSNNPELTEIVIPKSSGVMDQGMFFNTGLSDIRLDKLTGLINSPNVQIRCGDCPNLDTNLVAKRILSIDKNENTGRQFWVNGSTPDLSGELLLALQENKWTVVQ